MTESESSPPDGDEPTSSKASQKDVVAYLNMPPKDARDLMKFVAKWANTRMDLRFSGGEIRLLHLGDRRSRGNVNHVLSVLKQKVSSFKGRIQQIS